MSNLLLEYTNTKPEAKKLWKAILDYPTFDQKTNPFQARTVTWLAMQLTTNFPASKAEISKFLDGTTTLQKLGEGLSKSIEAKYKVKLDFTAITSLKHQEQMHTPSPELRTVYTALKTILTKEHSKVDVLTLLNKLFTNTEYVDQDIQECIYAPFQPTVFTVQTRFSEMLNNDAFRIYFKSADSKDSLPEILVNSERSLQKHLEDTFLNNLVTTGKPYCTLNHTYKMEK